MSEQTNRPGKSRPTLTHRVSEIELALREIETLLKQTIPDLENLAQRAEQWEKTTAQIADQQNQAREKTLLGPDPGALVLLEEGSVVDIDELEKRMEEKYSLLTTRVGELQDFQVRLAKNLDNVREEIREKDLLSAARETEIKSLKQSLGARIEELEKLVKSQAGREKRAPRLVSFLVNVGKKH